MVFISANNTSNNKRIVKNTIALSLRMLITMVIGLYTSRLVLINLGVTDYGIYNVVGGVVTMFSFLTSSMLNGTQRYLNYYIGKKDIEMLNRVYSVSINIFVVIGFLIVIIGETFGLYFLNFKLSIPSDRLTVANCVLQLSILSSFINIISIPYNAAIVAYEHMTAFAYISIVQSVVSLGIVFILPYFPFDRLVVYSTFLCLLGISIRIYYSYYVNTTLSELKYKFAIDIILFKEIFVFSAWTLTGTFAYVTLTQGLTMLFNIFFGPIVNSAQAFAQQVKGAITQFAGNFSIAAKPQITKSYAEGKIEIVEKLLYISAKLSFLIHAIISFPIILKVNYILYLWLKDVPSYTGSFLQIILLTSLVDTYGMQIVTALHATGNIRIFQIFDSLSLIIVLPLSYVCFKFGLSPNYAYLCLMGATILNLFVRIYFYRTHFKLSILRYFNEIVARCTITGLLSFLVLYYISLYVPDSIFGVFSLLSISATLLTLISIVLLLNMGERKALIERVKKFMK